MDNERNNNANAPAPNDAPFETQRQRGRGLKIFLITLAAAVALCAALAVAGILAYSRLTGGAPAFDVAGLFSDVPERTNFLILGVDGEGGDDQRTDFMMAGCFDAKNKRVTLVSIPRDTKVTMPESRRQTLSENGRWTPKTGVMKINEVAHYAGKGFAVEYAKAQAEDLFGVTFDFYVRVDLAALRDLVDAMGGVWFDVPQRMVYDDPVQNLHIDLQPGYQLLDGHQAEGVTRYRKGNKGGTPGYAEGDLGRAKVQQAFMKAVISQAIADKQFFTLAHTAFGYVRTDFPASNIPKYVSAANGLSADSIDTYTMPGSPLDGSPYYVLPDTDKIAELADIVFHGGPPAAAPDIHQDIRVLNGGHTKGLAAKWRDKLTELGYNVTEIGDYNGEQKPQTRIITAQPGMGKDIQQLFENATLETGATGNAGILIILGLNEE